MKVMDFPGDPVVQAELPPQGSGDGFSAQETRIPQVTQCGQIHEQNKLFNTKKYTN